MCRHVCRSHQCTCVSRDSTCFNLHLGRLPWENDLATNTTSGCSLGPGHGAGGLSQPVKQHMKGNLFISQSFDCVPFLCWALFLSLFLFCCIFCVVFLLFVCLLGGGDWMGVGGGGERENARMFQLGVPFKLPHPYPTSHAEKKEREK